MDDIVWIDVETTGLVPQEDSLIQIAAMFRDKIFNIYIKPTTLNRSPFPLKKGVNRITMEEADDLFVEYIKEIHDHFDEDENNKEKKLKWGGQNPFFDMRFLLRRPKIKNAFDTYFHYVPIDLFVLSTAFQRAGLLPSDVKLSLENTFRTVFGDRDVEFHDGLEDVKATAMVWNELIRKLTELASEK